MKLQAYENPVLRGFSGDPSICRSADGRGYYLVTSSFEYFPGVPLHYSEDLVHWELVNYVLKRREQLDLTDVPPSGGLWAPTIRCHEGRYYMTTTNRTMGGNFYVWTDDPRGDWSDPVFVDLDGIDPSFTFDGGHVYYYGACPAPDGTPGISMMEIDIATGKALTDIRFLWAGSGNRSPEAPHIYHIGDWYYLTIAEGGTQFGHMETAARSRNIWGPYEGAPCNPILTNVHTRNPEIQCTGHSDLIQDQNGNWWAVHIGLRMAQKYLSHIGRETFLSPVSWTEDGWPVINGRRWVEIESAGPLLPAYEAKEEPVRDDFEGDQLELCWNYLRNPDLSRYNLKERPGCLTLRGSALRLDDIGSPTVVCRRQKYFDCHMTAKMEFLPEQDGEEAGIAVFLSNEFYYKIGKRRENGEDFLVLEKRAEDFYQQVCKISVEHEKPLYLGIQAERLRYTFRWGYEESDVAIAGYASTRFLSCEVAGRSFTGAFAGMYATGNGRDSAAKAAFDFFEMKPDEESRFADLAT
ncbi:glycoside hydrolase family 43 protein [Cuneatibacter caecimuris]|uniref:Alpha-N-arabinofuranosidase n=1 Tax=Cuneatibacter caecimuris TaxID=1796618 RepID=A0A4Q7PNP8_9FIRM|nr:glycoside hydrolase family 43 protein [Cuneatibacter caecimuris]RZT02433.1 alpha-N-arabinofuranosidase [Cuneatibacter caecimuris]